LKHANSEKNGEMNKIAVVGLGYVGWPLATPFGKKFETIGFDLGMEKVENYRRHLEETLPTANAMVRCLNCEPALL